MVLVGLDRWGISVKFCLNNLYIFIYFNNLILIVIVKYNTRHLNFDISCPDILGERYDSSG